jgi:hypothetical protein
MSDHISHTQLPEFAPVETGAEDYASEARLAAGACIGLLLFGGLQYAAMPQAERNDMRDNIVQIFGQVPTGSGDYPQFDGLLRNDDSMDSSVFDPQVFRVSITENGPATIPIDIDSARIYVIPDSSEPLVVQAPGK